MKYTLIFSLLAISAISYGQFGMFNTSTWLYQFEKSETYSNEWAVPSAYGTDKTTYSISYAKDGNWQYVGNILVTGMMMGSKVYFKKGYRVAYAIGDAKPTEITFTASKVWKVE